MEKANRNQYPEYPGNHQTPNDLMLTAPYNFVPLSKEVVRPSWAHLISHNKPFKDGLSGQLTLTIKAEQPIFTRNNVSRRITGEEARKEAGSHFSRKPDGTAFIPGSSIKGSIRSVLEIMSFGDLAKGLNDERYGMRDLYHDDYKAMFSLHAKHKVHGGWLYESNGRYLLNDCGEPKKISQKDIDEQFNTKHFANFAEGRMQMSDGYKAAKKKYDLFADKSLDMEWEGTKGTLVFTGQPSANTKAKAKVNEFLFPTSSAVLEVDRQVMDNFKLAYYDSDKNSQKPDYKHWTQELKAGRRIPVFFHKNDKGEVASFGLAYMYKIPFTHSVKDAILRHQKNSGKGPDLAACIFGHIESNDALKGRVTFGHAIADKSVPTGVESEILNSPKPTYYPTYIRQDVDTAGKITTTWKALHPNEHLESRSKENELTHQTLFYSKAVPSGWKRYPVHSGVLKHNHVPDGSLNTKFCPLPAGTTFTCTVNYHNLTKVELGALLSALTFHNTEGCFHTLGMAKPLGYGKCTLSVNGIEGALIQECQCAYEQYMEHELSGKGGWLRSDQMRELLSMSSNQENSGRSKLEYMKEVGEFAKAKKEKLALDCYTKLEGITAKFPAPKCDTSKSSAASISTGKATKSPQEIFEAKKQELLQKLKAQKDAKARSEKQERDAATQRLKDEEAERLRKEKEELDRQRETERLNIELASGINLNGVQANKTIDGLLRTLKRWQETMGGAIDESTAGKIEARFGELFNNLKPKEKQPWIQKLKADLPKLDAFLSPEQIQRLDTHLNTLS